MSSGLSRGDGLSKGVPLYSGTPFVRPPPLERPLDNVNLNINVLISTIDGNTPLERPLF